MKRKIISLALSAVLFLTTGCSAIQVNVRTPAKPEDPAKVREAEALDFLGHELEAPADHLLKDGEDVDDIYSELEWSSVADTFPSKFDLRDRGTVTPVKDQSPWGTCWSFATIAASETSILNSLGMTIDSYREKYGEDPDLSEKHLAWFTAKALPEANEYPDGEYPYDISQAGEGLHHFKETDNEPLNEGGNYYLSATALADGIGILKEKYAPYSTDAGDKSKDGDWSLPEEERFSVSYELLNANILPSPYSYTDSETYRPAATEAVKTELLAGRAVGISFKADRSKPDQTPEEMKKSLEKQLADMDTLTDEEKEYYIDVRSGITDVAGLSEDDLRDLVRLRLKLNGLPDDTYDLEGFDHDQLAQIFMSGSFGKSYETIVEDDSKEPYMTFVGSDPVIYAQYTYENVIANHGVTVVGWDDDFSAENWPEDRRPPADGAWIVKNSWGEGWGNDGYFMLSYYDMSLCALGSFEYVVSEESANMDRMTILEYDYMPAEIISSTLFDSPVYAANIFETDEDCVLEYVSAMTGDMNTTVTASVYLLNDDPADPTDGVLLDSITDTFRYAGYHRLRLNDNLLLPANRKVSIVILENVPTENGSKYALINNSSLSKEGVTEFNRRHENEDRSLIRYAKAVVNPGESFVSFDLGNWTDWSDAIEHFGNMGSNAYMAYDNLPIKAYVYPLSEVEKVHDLSDRIPTVGGEAAICPEDGYTLLDITGN